jgi:hypothetical protein
MHHQALRLPVGITNRIGKGNPEALGLGYWLVMWPLDNILYVYQEVLAKCGVAFGGNLV